MWCKDVEKQSKNTLNTKWRSLKTCNILICERWTPVWFSFSPVVIAKFVFKEFKLLVCKEFKLLVCLEKQIKQVLLLIFHHRDKYKLILVLSYISKISKTKQGLYASWYTNKKTGNL